PPLRGFDQLVSEPVEASVDIGRGTSQHGLHYILMTTKVGRDVLKMEQSTLLDNVREGRLYAPEVQAPDDGTTCRETALVGQADSTSLSRLLRATGGEHC